MSYETTFWQDLCEKAGGEPIEAVVIGLYGYGRTDGPKAAVLGQILTAEQAEPMLDYYYDSGFGGVECHAVWAWTATDVLFVSMYDGSTNVESVPRHPTAGDPDMPGG